MTFFAAAFLFADILYLTKFIRVVILMICCHTCILSPCGLLVFLVLLCINLVRNPLKSKVLFLFLLCFRAWIHDLEVHLFLSCNDLVCYNFVCFTNSTLECCLWIEPGILTTPAFSFDQSLVISIVSVLTCKTKRGPEEAADLWVNANIINKPETIQKPTCVVWSKAAPANTSMCSANLVTITTDLHGWTCMMVVWQPLISSHCSLQQPPKLPNFKSWFREKKRQQYNHTTVVQVKQGWLFVATILDWIETRCGCDCNEYIKSWKFVLFCWQHSEHAVCTVFVASLSDGRISQCLVFSCNPCDALPIVPTLQVLGGRNRNMYQ